MTKWYKEMPRHMANLPSAREINKKSTNQNAEGALMQYSFKEYFLFQNM